MNICNFLFILLNIVVTIYAQNHENIKNELNNKNKSKINKECQFVNKLLGKDEYYDCCDEKSVDCSWWDFGNTVKKM